MKFILSKSAKKTNKQIKSNEENNPAESRIDKKERKRDTEREEPARSYGQKGKEGRKINSNILSYYYKFKWLKLNSKIQTH